MKCISPLIQSCRVENCAMSHNMSIGQIHFSGAFFNLIFDGFYGLRLGRSLGANQAGFGPSCQLDFVLCALRALRPCDPHTPPSQANTITRVNIVRTTFGDRQPYFRIRITVLIEHRKPSGLFINPFLSF